MGGHALKNVVTRRYQREEYFRLKQKILERIEGKVEQFSVPKEFPKKETFGDLDVLLVNSSNVARESLIQDLFKPREIVKNGDVFSFDVEQLQVDFIFVPEEEFENATVYLSYSDLGGLIGNICHKIGLKYGSAGLWLNVHTTEFDPTTTSTKVILSSKPEKIFDFLGFDFDHYCQGFNDENDFFEWIIQSKYFQRFYFDQDQLNHAHRKRTAKRPIYIKFIEFLDRKQIEHKETELDLEFIRSVRLRALEYFDKLDAHKKSLDDREEKKHFRQKFNGSFFCDVAESKKMIPELMNQFERRIAENSELFRRWVIESDQQTIEQEIQNFKTELLMSRKSE